MNFVPEFAPDAESQWHELDPALQELVWDKVEELVQNPPLTTQAYPDIVYNDDRLRHYIFLRVNIDRAKRKITVTRRKSSQPRKTRMRREDRPANGREKLPSHTTQYTPAYERDPMFGCHGFFPNGIVQQ